MQFHVNEYAIEESSTLLPWNRERRARETSVASQPYYRIALGFVVGIVFGVMLAKIPASKEIESSTAASILEVPLEGKSHHKEKHGKGSTKKYGDKKHKTGDDDESPTLITSCEDGKYSKRTLKLAYELPFAALFTDNKGQHIYEASSVVLSTDGYAYAVCDSSWAISKFDDKLEPFSPNNIQIGDPAREVEDSDYEALFEIDDGSFYVVRESIKNSMESYHALIEHLDIHGDDYDVVEICPTEFSFEGDSKGFEGAIAVRDFNESLVILALCEGNHCSEEKKFDVGNGRVVAMRWEATPPIVNGTGPGCQWSTIRTIHLPKSITFRDYSAMSLEKATGRIAITSQEDSQLWIGRLKGQDEVTGLWDVDAIEFDDEDGKIYDFPKNDLCETVYCNIEGIHWINSEMVMAVSDKMKGSGKQHFRCFDKDQSVHVFVIPS